MIQLKIKAAKTYIHIHICKQVSSASVRGSMTGANSGRATTCLIALLGIPLLLLIALLGVTLLLVALLIPLLRVALTRLLPTIISLIAIVPLVLVLLVMMTKAKSANREAA